MCGLVWNQEENLEGIVSSLLTQQIFFFLIFGVIETVFQPQCGAEG